MTNQQKEQIRTMRLQGVGYIKIGKSLGISDNTVRSFCRRNGLGDKSKNAVDCKQCGKLIKIIPKQKPKKFCSDACRNTWWNEHRDCVNRKANYEYTCACCGRNFTAYGNNHRKYCSHNALIFCFNDGSEITRIWKDRSRSQSWTDEMKEAARQKTLERSNHNA